MNTTTPDPTLDQPTPPEPQPQGPGTPTLLTALEALRSPGNLVLTIVATVLSLVVLAIAAGLLAHDAGLASLPLIVLAWLVGKTGYCAVTLRCLQLDRGEPTSGVVIAATTGFTCALKALLALLLLLAGLLLIMAAASLLFLITQIPGIGPALNYLVFPVVALIIGVALYALVFIAAPLAAVAACEGRSVFGTLATVVLVIRRRLFDTALRGVLLNLMTLFVVGLAVTVVTMGVGATGALQQLVQIGHTGNNMGMAASMGPLAALHSVGPTSIVLYFFAFSLGLVVYAAGWVVIFGETARDLDPAGLETQIRTQAEWARQKARETQARATQLTKERTSKSDKTPPAP